MIVDSWFFNYDDKTGDFEMYRHLIWRHYFVNMFFFLVEDMFFGGELRGGLRIFNRVINQILTVCYGYTLNINPRPNAQPLASSGLYF